MWEYYYYKKLCIVKRRSLFSSPWGYRSYLQSQDHLRSQSRAIKSAIAQKPSTFGTDRSGDVPDHSVNESQASQKPASKLSLVPRLHVAGGGGEEEGGWGCGWQGGRNGGGGRAMVVVKGRRWGGWENENEMRRETRPSARERKRGRGCERYRRY